MQLSTDLLTAPAESIRMDGAHLFWPVNTDELLIKSIRETGQAAPVLAMETAEGLALIAGRARVHALLKLKEPVLVRLVSEADDRDKGILFLTDNASRPLDDGMRFTALRYFHPLLNDKDLDRDILPRLGVKPKSKEARLLRAWLKLPKHWQQLMIKGNVPLAAGDALTRMEKADRETIEPLFSDFSWSRSNAVNMLTWLFETGKMTNTPMTEIMQAAGLTDILKQGLSPKDTIARLVASMKTTRYPELSRLQSKFTVAARELTAGTRWRMTQPNNFETGGAELTVQVKGPDQLEQAVRELETMAELSPWQTLWALGDQDD